MVCRVDRLALDPLRSRPECCEWPLRWLARQRCADPRATAPRWSSHAPPAVPQQHLEPCGEVPSAREDERRKYAHPVEQHLWGGAFRHDPDIRTRHPDRGEEIGNLVQVRWLTYDELE